MTYSEDEMKVKVNRAGADGWKPVLADGTRLGSVQKIGDDWRAQVGKTEYLGHETQQAAVDTVMAKQPDPEK